MESDGSLPHFLTLPSDIRHLIYKQILSHAGFFYVAAYQRAPEQKFVRLYPAILRTCKRIHSETFPYLYHNTLAIDSGALDSSNPTSFLNQIGKCNAQLLTEMAFNDFGFRGLPNLFRSAPNLRILHVRCALLNCAPSYHKERLDEFYRVLEPLVKEHPRMEKMVSRYRRGYCVSWPVINIRCVAGDVDWEIRETDVDVRDEGVDMSGQIWLDRMNRGKSGPPPIDEVQW